MPAVPTVAHDDHDALARVLQEQGCCLLAGLPSLPATALLCRDLLSLRDAGALQSAAIGQGRGRQQRSDVRGDRTLWLDDPRCGEVARSYLRNLDNLRIALNRRLFLGLRSVEAHYAAYPPGAGYARHRDSFRGSDIRVVSLVSYLNQVWRDDDGGELRLHLEDGAVDIAPCGGTTACFLSQTEHEVLPARRDRLSIAAWFRRDG